MIQRIQSIWLLLASLTMFCLLFIPIAAKIDGNIEYHLLASGLYEKISGQTKQVEAYLPLLISTLAIALTSLVNIFNFRKRAVQKRIALIVIVLIIGLSFWCSQYASKIPGGLENISYGAGAFLPVIAVIFSGLAIRGINNDEKLLRSADRLR